MIYFVKNKWPLSSNAICADETAYLLRRYGIKSESLRWPVYARRHITNSSDVFIFIKPSSDHLEKIQNRHVIIDLVDSTKSWRYDGVDYMILARSKERYYNLRNKFKNVDFIYHPVSKSFRIKTDNKNSLCVLYFGSIDNVNVPPDVRSLIQIQSMIPQKASFVKCPYREGLKAANMHVNLRDAPWKPTNKISQAAYSQSNILINLEAGGVEELLGLDYPYLCELNAEAIEDKLKYAEKTFRKRVWRKGLRRMKMAKSLTCDEAIVRGYVRVISRLGVEV